MVVHLIDGTYELFRRALLFKRFATLRTDAPLLDTAEELRWRGPTPEFAAWTERMEASRLLARCVKTISAIVDERRVGN